MPTLLRRKLRCHYCNTYSRNEHAGIPRSWLCLYCDAVNHLDARGNITDPPAEDISSSPAPPVHFVRSRSTTPVMSESDESPFCDSCQRNQRRLYDALAAYIPDEDDPEFEKYDNAVEEYRAQLEERWPQVCEDCIERVQERIRAAGYAAKADNLRRVLEQSKKYQTDAYTPRQFWTNVVVTCAKWAYLFNVGVGLLWHAFGSVISTDRGGDVDWRACAVQTIQMGRVEWACVISPLVLDAVKCALVADLLTLWWNPKLAQKTNRAGGRMRGLKSAWVVRVIVLFLRFIGLLALDTVDRSHDSGGIAPSANADAVGNYRTTHMVLFSTLLIGTLYAWNSVRVVYQSTKSLMQPLGAHLPSAGPTEKKRSPYKKPLPNNTSFDTMAQAFTSTFSSKAEPSSAYPPSPTLTSTSSFSQDSDTNTPYKTQSTLAAGDDSMDWTPTQRRFAPHQPTIVPSAWAQPPSPTTHFAPAREPVSIFSKPDPNPFRHRVPTAPKAPAAAKANPWKPGIWAPPLKETTPNFFKEAKKQVHGTDKGLEGVGVPKRVQRDAELFAPPKFKYDNYGEMKETGLEDTFNGLFSK